MHAFNKTTFLLLPAQRHLLRELQIKYSFINDQHVVTDSWTMDDLEEATAISIHVHRNFIHKFIYYGKEVLYPKYVTYPTTPEAMKIHTQEYEKAGFHGAFGSMDACHIVMEKCSHRLKQNHMGGKSKHTCHAFNLTCNHRRQILYTTPGHPARWNDKTIILYDLNFERFYIEILGNTCTYRY